MHLNKTVAIINIESGNEEALRQMLEYFGYTVVMYEVGRPQHFIDLLAGKLLTKFDFIVISCHGEDGEIIMPELGEDIYYPDEPRGNFGFNEINKYLTWKDTCIISIGCTTGDENLAKAFAKNNNTYIAPTDYIEGDSTLMFAVLFFYYLCSDIHKLDIEAGYKKASSLDSETNYYIMETNPCPTL